MGSNPGWKLSLLALLTLSRDHNLRYRERSRRRLIIETDFDEIRVVALVVIMYDMY